jgi:hypothetical protein
MAMYTYLQLFYVHSTMLTDNNLEQKVQIIKKTGQFKTSVAPSHETIVSAVIDMNAVSRYAQKTPAYSCNLTLFGERAS